MQSNVVHDESNPRRVDGEIDSATAIWRLVVVHLDMGLGLKLFALERKRYSTEARVEQSNFNAMLFYCVLGDPSTEPAFEFVILPR